jgi:formylglycine-generating enzyme required for sulfatase activity
LRYHAPVPARQVRARSLAIGLLAGLCASCANTLPPFGEVVLSVDTDARVPQLVGRLRVDIYDEAGTWLDSRETGLPRASDWPASFSLYYSDTVGTRTLLVRLRAFPDGKLRDYHGERYLPPPSMADPLLVIADPPPPPGETPRLVHDGVDVTPTDEPMPALTIDRLVRVVIAGGLVQRADVLLASVCDGVMADLAHAATCVDRGGTLADTSTPVPLVPPDTPPPPSLVGTWPPVADCTVPPRPVTILDDGSSLYNDDVCVPGGIYILGSLVGASISGAPEFRTSPERVAAVPSLLVDRNEVTVGRWRDAVLRGFNPDFNPGVNDKDQPLPTSSAGIKLGDQCTYSHNPLRKFGRESFPLNCLSYTLAEQFCEFEGGTLLTEAQWEWVASASGRSDETLYAWGTATPSCTGEVYGREDSFMRGLTDCVTYGYGPQPITAGPGDLTPGAGIIGLGGSMQEWVSDAFASYDTACWRGAPVWNPSCQIDKPMRRSIRGGCWSFGTGELDTTLRDGDVDGIGFEHVGFRCARPGTTP